MKAPRVRISWIENVGFALLAMRTQKLRSFLTLLGVMAGVATVTSPVPLRIADAAASAAAPVLPSEPATRSR